MHCANDSCSDIIEMISISKIFIQHVLFFKDITMSLGLESII